MGVAAHESGSRIGFTNRVLAKVVLAKVVLQRASRVSFP